jgi:hypothetical protein
MLAPLRPRLPVDRDAQSNSSGVQIAVRRGGIFPELLPGHTNGRGASRFRAFVWSQSGGQSFVGSPTNIAMAISRASQPIAATGIATELHGTKENRATQQKQPLSFSLNDSTLLNIVGHERARRFQNCLSGSTSGMWKRSQGRTTKAPPEERGGNGYVRPTTTAPHLDSNIFDRVIQLSLRVDVRFDPESDQDRAATQYVAKGPGADLRSARSYPVFVGPCRRA